jgi:hypothetical protein
MFLILYIFDLIDDNAHMCLSFSGNYFIIYLSILGSNFVLFSMI